MYIIEEKEKENRTKKISIVLIVLATLFSQVFLFRFDVTHDIKFIGIWFHHVFPLLRFGQMFDTVIITSAIIGYALFFIFLMLTYKKAKQNHSRFITAAIILCACAILHEAYIYILAYFDNFTPQPFFTGIPLLLFSMEVFNSAFDNKE